jgi:osmotically-inducible protein OsmY
MNRNFDIFRMGANGVDPDRGTARADQTRARTSQSAEPPFGHGIHNHPDEYRHHAQELEGSAEHGYEQNERSAPYSERGGARAQPYGGVIGDRERFIAERERRERDRYEAQREQRARYDEEQRRQQLVRGQGVREMRGYPQPPPTTYGNTPYTNQMSSQMTSNQQQSNVWRGRDEQHDFWGYDRDQEHPSLWDRVKGVFHGRGPKNYVRSDERIHEDVCEHLAYHPYVDASDIEVIVRDGEVTLTGTVDGRMVKRAAEDCVDHVRGVKDVHNHLRVRREDASTPSTSTPSTSTPGTSTPGTSTPGSSTPTSR